jgi:uncharacterized membrane protein YozB (DUF420 family)
LTRSFRSAKFRFVFARRYATVSIALGLLFFFAGVIDIRQHYGFWATASILFGVFLIIFGAAFGVKGERQKSTRRLSYGFLGGALVFLAIALAVQS